MKLLLVSNDAYRRQACRQALHELGLGASLAAAFVSREASFDPLDLQGAAQARAWAEANLRAVQRQILIPTACVTICVVQEGLGEHLCIGGATANGTLCFEDMHSNDGPSGPDPIVEGLKRIIKRLIQDEAITSA